MKLLKYIKSGCQPYFHSNAPDKLHATSQKINVNNQFYAGLFMCLSAYVSVCTMDRYDYIKDIVMQPHTCLKHSTLWALNKSKTEQSGTMHSVLHLDIYTSLASTIRLWTQWQADHVCAWVDHTRTSEQAVSKVIGSSIQKQEASGVGLLMAYWWMCLLFSFSSQAVFERAEPFKTYRTADRWQMLLAMDWATETWE